MKKHLNQFYKFINSHFLVLITIAIILSLILIGAVGVNVWKMYEGFTEVVSIEFELENLTGQIVYLDEALTMSARMAAATGNLDWEKRYLKLKPQLDKDINRLITIAPESYEPHGIETNAANIELLKIEQQSFNLVRQGKEQQAFKLLLSPQYQFDKEIYASGINKTVASLQTRIRYNIDSYRKNLFVSALFSVINFPILLLIWASILSSITWYISQNKRAIILAKTAFFELEKSNKTLEYKVKKRTIELQKSLDKIQAANHSKELFFANITHELRSPINSILGVTKILQRDSKIDSNQMASLNIISQSGTHLLTLINDLLDFSKTNAQKIKLNPKTIHLQSFLDKIIGMANPWIADQEILLNLSTSSQLPANIKVDEQRLFQVLINLLNNSVKFTISGEINLKVTVVKTPLLKSSQGIEQTTLRFQISDTGLGMNSQELDKIFQPFEQIDNFESRSKGTGLGLSIAKQLVELMGSQLQVKSQLGSGSSFWFDLMFPKEEIAENSRQEPIDKILGYKGNKRKLLIVDDKIENCQLLREILQPIGFEVETASNGQQMLSIVTATPPDLILLDLYMPIKTGFTASKELRQIPELKNIPIIIITAALISEEMLNYLDCQVVLYKPINKEQLLLSLQKYLELDWIYAQAA
ncbi:MAG: ATP-binding protein [Prochloraceae cyanobacterium]|nr:ATP-binding protein [Prochloraceae cyanobacterium]